LRNTVLARRIAVLVLLLLSSFLTADANMLTPGDHRRSLDFDGRTRTYLVHVPTGLETSRPTPVVLAFHGGGSNADAMVGFCGLNETANREKFVVVYPNGTGRTGKLLTWNAGNCCAYAVRENVDDVGFVRALLDDLSTVVKVDPHRTFATGMSNGAMMAYRLASELSDRIAAIAPVSGPMGTDTCRPKRPVPVLHFHGTADEFAPFCGGRGKKSFTQSNFHSVEFSLGNWIEANGCSPTVVESEIADEHHDGTSIKVETWGPGKEGSEVVLYTIKGGGHTWPGRTPPIRFLGPSTTNVSANEIMWSFFQKHPMK